MGKKHDLRPYEDDIFVGMISKEKSETPLKGEYIRLKHRIPKSAFDQICTVFNHCQFKLDGSEGFVVLMNDDSPEWRVGVPRQWNGGAHVDAHPEMDPGVFTSVVGDAHSHPNMTAFHSSIDVADEAEHRKGLFLVFSSTDSGFSQLTSVVNVIGIVRERRFNLHPMDVFDLESKLPSPPIIPADWKKNISTEACPKCPKPKRFDRDVEAVGASADSFWDWIKRIGRHRGFTHGGGLWEK
jgi:hypothetical protein